MARMTKHSRGRKARLVRSRREARHTNPGSQVLLLFSSAFGGLALLSVVCLGSMLLSLVAGLGVAYASIANEMQAGLDRIHQIDSLSAAFQTTTIYDRNGKLLYEIYGEGRRTKITLKDIPKPLIDATIATEDETFYDNPGVDVQGILRGVYRYLCCKDVVGGSTITQQLVRHVAFDYEERVARDPKRKVKEILLALELNRMKSKDEILELYLNEIYYGDLAYGIEAAAQTIFGKDARDLDLAESALLAGLPQSPAELDPLDPASQAAAKERQQVVLRLMVKHGYLTPSLASLAEAEELHYAPAERGLAPGTLAPHFIVYIRKLLEDRYGAARVARGGLRVTTTLDSRYQQLAEQIAKDQVDKLRAEHDLTDAAVVALKPGTGEILAMVGSVDYWNDAIKGRVNVAVAHRQPGSSMKPLTYALAFAQGLTPADLVWDVDLKIPLGRGQDYVPHNYDDRFHGPVRLRQALANSYNIPAIQVMRAVGVENLLHFVHDKLGMQSLTPDRAADLGLSLTLGAGEVQPLEMSAAYAMFANGGNYVPPVAILKVEDSTGQVIQEYTPPQPQPVLDPRIAYQISSILSDNDARTPAFGANSPLKVMLRGTNKLLPAAVKTGTTNDYKDNWTVGYTPNLAIAVWAGNADNHAMRHVSGVQGAAPIWHDLMQGIYVDPTLASVIGVADLGNPPSFRRPDGIQERSVCVLSALKNDIADCPARSKETFLASPARRYDRSVPAEAGGMPDPKARTTVVPEGQATVIPGVPLPVEEGVVKMQVVPLFQTVISGTQVISETLPNLNVGSGDPMSLPVPRYCAVTSAADQQSGAVTQLFIVAPNSPLYRVPMMEGLPDAEAYTIAAQRWAASAGIAIAPAYSCTPELLAQVHQQQPQPGNGDPGSTGNQPGNEHIETTYTIASPHPEQVITQTLPIIGTALFSPDNIDYYKITIQGPAFRNNEETTLGNTHTAPIRNGVLETLGAPSLPPGRYILRLILVQKDGNFSHPFQVPIVIAPPGGFPPGP